MKKSLLATLFGSLLVLSACQGQADVTGDLDTDLDNDDAIMEDDSSSETIIEESSSSESSESSSVDETDSEASAGVTASVGIYE